MAVDTANKRYSMIGLALPVPWMLPIPDGDIAAADRAQLLQLYSGIPLSSFTIHTTYPQLLTAEELALMRAVQELDQLTAGEMTQFREVQQMAQPGTAYIQRVTLSSDGMGGQTETWTTTQQVSARWGVRPMAGREFESGEQLTSVNEWTISVPWDTTVEARDRIVQVDSNKVFEVTFVPNGQSYQTAKYLTAVAINEETT